MSKRKKITLAAACLLVAVATFALLTHQSEPSYQGLPLSAWLAISSGLAEGRSAASPDEFEGDAAVRAIGTNAIPYLLKWIANKQPFWTPAAYAVLPRPVWARVNRLFIVPAYERALGAEIAFDVLGTNAACAIPDLAAMTKDADAAKARRAIHVLVGIGPLAIPHLCAALRSPNQKYRDQIALAVGAMLAFGASTNECLPQLIAALNDSNPEIRSAASTALRGATNAPAQ
jgi:hypothetical protein